MAERTEQTTRRGQAGVRTGRRGRGKTNTVTVDDKDATSHQQAFVTCQA